MAQPPAPPPPRLLDRVRAALRIRHCSLRTEKAYVGWIRRYIFFHGKRHPADMGAAEITRFLSDLAIQRNVAASTQNQALSALLFLYREVLEQELPWLDDNQKYPGLCNTEKAPQDHAQPSVSEGRSSQAAPATSPRPPRPDYPHQTALWPNYPDLDTSSPSSL
jgi:hypothetical protein